MLEKEIEEAKRVLRLGAQLSDFYYDKPLIITYSGGKDSEVLLHLAMNTGIKFEVLNSHTTVDAPETVYHIRKKFKQLEEKGIKATIHYPVDKAGKPISMWSLIEKKGVPPTRLMRYCCQELKETSTPNRVVATGVRAEESNQRRTRSEIEVRGKTKADRLKYTVEHAEQAFLDSELSRKASGGGRHDEDVYDCKLIANAKQNNDLIVNPIFTWTSANVWDYIHKNGIEYNQLYDRGYGRVGCVGCPLGGRKSMVKEFNDYPKYKQLYINALDKAIEKRKKEGKKNLYETGADWFDWWIEDETIKGQITINEWLKEKE